MFSTPPFKYRFAVAFVQGIVHSRLKNILNEGQIHLPVVVQNDTFHLLQLLGVQRYDNILPFHSHPSISSALVTVLAMFS